MGLFNLLFRNITDSNDVSSRYPEDLKAWCQNRDKYSDTWQKYAKYREKINHYYSNFINNGLQQIDLVKLENYCNKFLELVPDLIKSLKEEKSITHDTNMIINEQSYYSFVYKKLVLAYQKQGDYQKALDLCNRVISLGITDDGTKMGFIGRAERLSKKLNT